ncbi:unnamed protein product [Arctia plantaginis]|uniref:Uncharacterized protein n=1 Tax=Arctia plantaginis TaxID=874455 RepID=A0A8S1ARJ0_ARCPL|nr:unnamed protein product [Arctia plantaginis]
MRNETETSGVQGGYGRVSCARKVFQTVNMKLTLLAALFGFALAAPNVLIPVSPELRAAFKNNAQVDERNPLPPIMVLLFNLLRGLILNGSPSMGIPVLDPLQIDNIRIAVPAEIVNLDLELWNIRATGLGGFEVHSARLNLLQLSFEIDVTLPNLDISAERYSLTGDLLTAVPLFGDGKALFNVQGLRFKGRLFLGQSPNGRSVIVDRLENIGFQIGNFKSGLTGVIGGGDIDKVVNALIGEVVIDYVNRFQGFISTVIARSAPPAINPVLERFDSWDIIGELFQ